MLPEPCARYMTHARTLHETAAQVPRGQRVAFFGGSFDPPHLGHLAVARAARAALGLDTVLFAPVGAQPLKLQRSTASFADRLDLTRLAIAGEPGFAVSLAMRQSLGRSQFHPGDASQPACELPPTPNVLPDGADSFLGLRQWHRAAEIPFVAPLIVASRPNHWPVFGQNCFWLT